MKEIYSKQDYKEHFGKFINNQNDTSPKAKEQDKAVNKKTDLKETLLQALEVRKFEIELYWKRATYFWTFIAAAFAGYFAVLTSSNIGNHKPIVIVISIIGLLFSLGWYLVNRGSKYWQTNWETHVGILENEVIGPLFKTWKNPNKSLLKEVTGEYPFSVSKINQILSFVVFLIWVYLVGYSVSYIFEMTCKYANVLNMSYFVFVFGFAAYQFIANAESGGSKYIKKRQKESKLERNVEEKKKHEAELISFED